jgi:DNA-binding MarR family transcriptional regulator
LNLLAKLDENSAVLEDVLRGLNEKECKQLNKLLDKIRS